MRRESLLGDPSFRAHLVCVTTGGTGALLLVLSAAVLIPLFHRFDNAASLDELRSVTQQILDLHARFWPVVFVSLVSVFLSSWLLYRRMVEPLVRFVRVFDAVRAGTVPEPITLRSTDYLRHEAESLNAMLAALRAREAELESLRSRVNLGG